MSAYKLPLEIWQKIASLACTDDGTTGCSLSLVSKYINAASSPYRYQTVVLRGRKQIRAFLNAIKSSAGAHGSRPPPAVAHLFLADVPTHATLTRRSPAAHELKHVRELANRRAAEAQPPLTARATLDERAALDRETGDFAGALLACVSPALRSCALVGAGFSARHGCLRGAFAAPLPRLAALWTPDFARWLAGGMAFPALRLVHVLDAYADEQTAVYLDERIAELCGVRGMCGVREVRLSTAGAHARVNLHFVPAGCTSTVKPDGNGAPVSSPR
jgi:hypothetical protein